MRQRNPSRERLDHYIREFARTIPAGARVLDAGAGNCLYRDFFAHACYESADFGKVDKAYGQLTYVCRLDAIPVRDDSFDAILMSQVLEHLDEPHKVLSELFRVLKPGCGLWLSAPLYYEEHEQPYDFYRYTQFGMRHLLEKGGFEIVTLDSLEGYFGTLCYQADLAARSLPVSPGDYGGGWKAMAAAAAARASRPILRWTSHILAGLEMRAKFTRAGHCKNYYALARKPQR